MNISDLSDNLKSNAFLDLSRKINLFATLVVAFIGLIGHSLIIFVFGHKRFRTNSSNVFLFCLASNDSLFIIIHLFEDTIRTYKDIYINDSNSEDLLNQMITFLDITDRFGFICILINYLRYVLRFISSYIQVAFTIQRLSIVYSPLTNRFKSKKSAWGTCFMIAFMSCIVNIWTYYLFELQTDEAGSKYCDVKKIWSSIYFKITALYIVLVILIPIVLIFISNSIIIGSLIKSNLNREKLNKQTNKKLEPLIKSEMCSPRLARSTTLTNSKTLKTVKDLLVTIGGDLSPTAKLKPFYSSVIKIANKPNSNSATKILLLITFVFGILNLPYLIVWFIFYYQMAFNQMADMTIKDYLFALLQICEIFYMLNYAILFYIYCCSGSKFRNQLKCLSEFFLTNNISHLN